MSVVVAKLVELEALVQLASVLTTIVNGPFTVNSATFAAFIKVIADLQIISLTLWCKGLVFVVVFILHVALDWQARGFKLKTKLT